MWENIVELDKPQMTIQYGACAMHAGYLRLQTHTHREYVILLSHYNNGYTNAPQCYVMCTLPVLLISEF